MRKLLKNKYNIKKNIDNNIIIKKPTKSWQSIIINFITKLLKFKNLIIKIKYDSIWVIVDYFIKWTHVLSFRKIYIIKKFDLIWQDRMVRNKKYFKKIISDRNKFFISIY